MVGSDDSLSFDDSLTSTGKEICFTFRLGQGGFTDNRSPIGKLGGGQVALDIKLREFPFALSISNEYYTNSSDPTHSYEIAGLVAFNFLYMTNLFNTERIIFFAGGGMGVLEVPVDAEIPHDPPEMKRGFLYNFEGGVNVIAFWKIGFYGVYKYLYSNKEINDVKVIDFSEHIVLLGITLNFGF